MTQELKLSTSNTMTTTVAVINDTHHPFQDKKIIRLVDSFLEEYKPNVIIYNGDLNDFYQVSVFDKNPDRVTRLQDDVDQTKAYLRKHREMMPDTLMYFLEGNHEYRWQKFLWTKAPEMSSLDCLNIKELFNLNDLGIIHLPYEEGLMINGLFLVTHGDIASIHSGYTAKRMYEKHGGCGICGHCHRGGSFYKRDRFGVWGWWENFCLCTLDPDWMKNPNWTQGFSLIHFRGRHRFWVEQIPIIKGGFMYGGNLYE